MKLDIKGLAILALIVAALAFFWFSSAGGTKPVPAFSVTTLDGQQISSKTLQGKPYLVTFWSTGCPGCVGEIPHLVELDQKLHGTGFRIIAISMPYDELQEVQTMRAQKGMKYDVAHDQSGELGTAFGGINVTPTSFLVDASGKIVRQQLGEFDFTELEQQIRALLKG